MSTTITPQLESIEGIVERITLMGLRHFLAPKGAENISGQGKQVDDLKTPETLENTRLMPI
ncbi:MAG TPA: hypothetical protein V6C91_22745 [Coleofasciculaceae cyanobacterium]